jgi:hypothetical protein
LLSWTHFDCRQQLALPDHVHEFDAGKRHRGRPEGLEPQHRPYQPLDGSMILFDDVVEVFDLTDLNARRIFGVVAFDRRRVGTAFADRDFRRRSIRFCRKVPSTARIATISDNGINRIWFTGRNRKPTLPQNRPKCSGQRDVILLER